jgi:hypothetical protein
VNSVRGQANQALLTLDDVAGLLCVSKAWVRDHATRRNPRIPTVRVGGKRAVVALPRTRHRSFYQCPSHDAGRRRIVRAQFQFGKEKPMRARHQSGWLEKTKAGTWRAHWIEYVRDAIDKEHRRHHSRVVGQLNKMRKLKQRKNCLRSCLR